MPAAVRWRICWARSRRKINEQRLRRPRCALVAKGGMEMFLKDRLGELFGLDYDLLLYDVTSTYFEGQAEGNPPPVVTHQDHRPDCKAGHRISLVVLAAMGCRWATRSSRKSQRRDHVAGDHADGAAAMVKPNASGSWIAALVSAENIAFLKQNWPALHRGRTQEHAQAIRAGASGRGLAHHSRGLGSKTLSWSGGRGNLRVVPHAIAARRKRRCTSVLKNGSKRG